MYNNNIFARSFLEVDLFRVVANYHKIISMVGNTNIGVAVKADSYGLGAHKIAPSLYKAGCKDFYFAYIDEIEEVRKKLRKANIYLLSGLQKCEFSYAVRYGIIPVLNSLKEVEEWSACAKQQHKRFPAVIHLETGMGRLGLQMSDIERLIASNYLEFLDVKYVMSHLACAHDPAHLMNQQQLKTLKALSAFFPETKISFANSAGIFLGKKYHMDQVRPGCSIYGVNPTLSNVSPFMPVATLKACVLQVREMERDQTISYNCLHHAKKGAKIATLACGYADGYHRLLTNNAYGFYAGFRLPIVGTVTMDMVMADVSEVPDRLLENMEYVELLGENITVDELAERAKTIGYEILTSLGHRFKRIYTE